MKLETNRWALSLLGVLMLIGCGSDSKTNNDEKIKAKADVVVATRIDDERGYINTVKADVAHNSSNTNGISSNPTGNIAVYKDAIFVSEGISGDKIIKYIKNNGIFEKSAEINTGEGSLPTSTIFASDTKAYVALTGTGQLLVFNPSDMTITKRIDLSAYAMDANGNVDGNDTNPEPSSGIIRDGKLYMGMFQVDTFQTFKCRGRASLLVIDVATDAVLYHFKVNTYTYYAIITHGETNKNNQT